MFAVSTLIDDQISAIRQLCQRHHVARLELFGSATTEKFRPEQSDLDFLVDFEPLSPVDRSTAYFGLLAALQDLFHRDIDLVESQAISNPYLKQSVDRTRTVLYASVLLGEAESLKVKTEAPKNSTP